MKVSAADVLPTEYEGKKLHIELRSRALLLAKSGRPAFTEVSSSEDHVYHSDIGRTTSRRSVPSMGIK